MTGTQSTVRDRPARVVVTGASRGIGRAVAERLLADGTHVALVGRDAAMLDGVRRGRVHGAVIVADLNAAGSGARIVSEAERALGYIDGLVGCAGVVDYAPVGEIAESSLRAQLEVDFVQPLLLAQALAVHMRHTRRSGAFVHVTSTLAQSPAPATAAYAAAKAALTSMTRSFALELASARIRVNAVAPGVVDTDMVRVPRRAVKPGENPLAVVDAQLEALGELHPLGRLGVPQDVVEAVLFALEATWMTGAVLTLDGGASLGSGAC